MCQHPNKVAEVQAEKIKWEKEKDLEEDIVIKDKLQRNGTQKIKKERLKEWINKVIKMENY